MTRDRVENQQYLCRLELENYFPYMASHKIFITWYKNKKFAPYFPQRSMKNYRSF